MIWHSMKDTAVLLIECPDRKGLVAAVASLLYRCGANIVHADQHQDHEAGLFFMRVEFALDGFDLPAFEMEFQQTAEELHMNWRLKSMRNVPRVAIFVSHYLHCLVDILHRHQTGELPCAISLVISNHPDAATHARFYGVEFHEFQVESASKSEVEAEQRRLLSAAGMNSSCWRGICRFCPPNSLRNTRPGSSMYIILFYPRSPVQSPITAPFDVG